jgi:hypothetical protein
MIQISTTTISLPILYTHMATGQKEKKKALPVLIQSFYAIAAFCNLILIV